MGNIDSSSEDLPSAQGIRTPRKGYEASQMNHTLPTRRPNCSESNRGVNQSCESIICTIEGRDEISMTQDVRLPNIHVLGETENNSRMHSNQQHFIQDDGLEKDEVIASQTMKERNLPKKTHISFLLHDDTEDKPGFSNKFTKSCEHNTLRDVPPRQVKRAPSHRYVYRKQHSFATLCNEALEQHGLSLHSVATEASMTDRNHTTTAKSSHQLACRDVRHHQKPVQRTSSAESLTGHSSSVSEVSSLGSADEDFLFFSEDEGYDDKSVPAVRLVVDESFIANLVSPARKEESYPTQCRIEDFVPKRPVRHLSPPRFP